MRSESACLPGGAAALIDCSGLLTFTWKFASGTYAVGEFFDDTVTVSPCCEVVAGGQ